MMTASYLKRAEGTVLSLVDTPNIKKPAVLKISAHEET